MRLSFFAFIGDLKLNRCVSILARFLMLLMLLFLYFAYMGLLAQEELPHNSKPIIVSIYSAIAF